MIKRKKDLTHCLGMAHFSVFRWESRFYRGYLWQDQASMVDNIDFEDTSDNDSCYAACTHAPLATTFPKDGPITVRAPRLLGELHFIRGKWNLEVVSHECLHALKNICLAMNIQFMLDNMHEEKAAYIHGVMVKEVYAWLCHKDRLEKPSRWELIRQRIRKLF